MLVGEHYYTASRHRNGFFAIDYAPILSKEDVDQLDAVCLYAPPIGLPARPSDEEIKSSFPIGHYFYKLASGRYAYTHAVYTGRSNHTPDRFGNFFAHTVVLKEGIPSFPAVLLFDRVKFKKSLPEEEDVGYRSNLQERDLALDTGEHQIQEAYSRLASALKSDPAMLAAVAQTLDLIAEGYFEIKGKKITLCADRDRVAQMIFGINLLLPQTVANRISLATYVSNPTSRPFQLSGVIPECEIGHLDASQHVMINYGSVQSHVPRQEYTKRVLAMLALEVEESFRQWRKWTIEIEEWVVDSRLDLNVPSEFENFLAALRSKSLADLERILTRRLPKARLLELWSTMSESNPALYLEYLRSILLKSLQRANTFENRFAAFKQIYQDHFYANEQFRREHFASFAETFREEMRGERNTASVFILLHCNCHGLLNERWLAEKMQDAEYWVEDDRSSFKYKVQTIARLSEHYDLSVPEFSALHNVGRLRCISDMQKAGERGELLDYIQRERSRIAGLAEQEKVTAFLFALNGENRKGRFDLSYNRYTPIIDEFFPTTNPDFWQAFFERNSYHLEGDFNRHSLGYLKRRFVLALFLNGTRRFEGLNRLALDTVTVRWVEDELKELATDPSVLTAFNQVFRGPQQRPGGWLAGMNPFKPQ
jgi:hypothetical protein